MNNLLDNPRMVVVYIASPFTQGDQMANVQRQMDTASILGDLKLCPIWPLHSYFLDERHPRPWEYWMALCAEWVRRSDIVLRLDGKSVGADMEVQLAHDLKIPVVYTVEEAVKVAGELRWILASHTYLPEDDWLIYDEWLEMQSWPYPADYATLDKQGGVCWWAGQPDLTVTVDLGWRGVLVERYYDPAITFAGPEWNQSLRRQMIVAEEI